MFSKLPNAPWFLGAGWFLVVAPATAETNAFPDAKYQPPTLLKRSKVELAPRVLAKRLTGSVEVELLVDRKGRVTDRQLTQRSRHELLDLAALCAVREWRFTPARSNGLPVTARCRQRFDFAPADDTTVKAMEAIARKREVVYDPEKSQPEVYWTADMAKFRRGIVNLLFELDTEGRVATIRIEKSSGRHETDYLVMSAVYHWRFKMDGKRKPLAAGAPLLLPIKLK